MPQSRLSHTSSDLWWIMTGELARVIHKILKNQARGSVVISSTSHLCALHKASNSATLWQSSQSSQTMVRQSHCEGGPWVFEVIHVTDMKNVLRGAVSLENSYNIQNIFVNKLMTWGKKKKNWVQVTHSECRWD